MRTTKDRIKELRKALDNMPQDTFAKKVGLTKNYISLVETGNRSLADRTVKDICRIFDVNEEWLRNGTGEMFVQKSKDEQIAEMLADIQKEGDASFKHRLISALTRINESDWDTLEKLIDEIASK